jgi:hypothetical protein
VQSVVVVLIGVVLRAAVRLNERLREPDNVTKLVSLTATSVSPNAYRVSRNVKGGVSRKGYEKFAKMEAKVED